MYALVNEALVALEVLHTLARANVPHPDDIVVSSTHDEISGRRDAGAHHSAGVPKQLHQEPARRLQLRQQNASQP